VQTVFSHLAASDSAAHDGFTAQQAATFTGSDEIQNALGYTFIRHMLIHLLYIAIKFTTGYGAFGHWLYGVDSNESMQQQLQNVTTLKLPSRK